MKASKLVKLLNDEIELRGDLDVGVDMGEYWQSLTGFTIVGDDVAERIDGISLLISDGQILNYVAADDEDELGSIDL